MRRRAWKCFEKRWTYRAFRLQEGGNGSLAAVVALQDWAAAYISAPDGSLTMRCRCARDAIVGGMSIHRFQGRGSARIGPNATSTLLPCTTLAERWAECRDQICRIEGRFESGGGLYPGVKSWRIAASG